MKPHEFKRFLNEKYQAFQENDYFALLDVDESSSTDAIKTAYFQLVKIVHPDRVTRGAAPDLAEKADRVFRAMTAAYNTLTDDALRAKYLAQRAGGEGDDGEESAGGSDEARIFAHRGEMMLRRRAYGQAAEFLRKAVDSGATDSQVYVMYGFALFSDLESDETTRLEDARRAWDRALELDARNPDVHFHLSLYWKARGDSAEQRRALKDTLSLDPKHMDAQRELRLLEMRTTKTEGAGGFFARIKAALTKKR